MQYLQTGSVIIEKPRLRMRTRVLRNFSSLVMVKGLSLIAPVIALPYILRTVGLENYGHLAFAVAIATFVGTIIQYGFPVTGVKAVAEVRDDSDRLTRAFWGNFLASLLLGFAVIAVHLAIVLSVPSFREMWQLHVGAILLAAGNAMVPYWLFLGLERSYFATISTFIVRVSYLLLLVIFVRRPEDYILINFLGAATAWLNVLLGVMMAVGMFKLPPVRIAFKEIAAILRGGFSSFLLQWTPSLYNSASIVLLGFHVTPGTMGAFNAANTVVTLVGSLGQLLANAFLPILSTAINGHRISSRLLMITGLVVTVALILVAPLCSRLLADSGRDLITQNLYYLALSLPFLFGYFAYGYNYVALMDSTSGSGVAVLVISLLGILLSFFLVPAFGAAGVAMVLFAGRGSMFALSYGIYRKHRSSSGR